VEHEKLLNADELGARYNVTGWTVLKWARDGLIPCHRVGRKIVRFKLSDVMAALDRAERQAVSA
jgi:excisionase family DNA binding protein